MRCILILSLLSVAAYGVHVPEDDDGYHADILYDHIMDDAELHMAEIRSGHGVSNQKPLEPCPAVCPSDYSPVCGSDGHTYNNKCELALMACRTRKRVYVERQGKCD